MAPDRWVEPSDTSGPSLYLAATTWENQSKNHPAEPSEPTEPWEQILNCVLSHCSVGWFVTQQRQTGTLEWEPKLTTGPPFLSDLIPSALSHPHPHPSLCSHHTVLLSMPQTYPAIPPASGPLRWQFPLLECATPGSLMAHCLTHVWCFYVTFSVRPSLPERPT